MARLGSALNVISTLLVLTTHGQHSEESASPGQSCEEDQSAMVQTKVAMEDLSKVMAPRMMGSRRIASGERIAGKYVPGSDGTYSQNYQDTWMTALARHNGWDKSGGFFFDLGAFDGLKCSNSALVEKQFGWRGVCVEPRPLASAFEQRTCLEVTRALSDVSGKEVRFYGRPGTQLQHIDKQSIDSNDDKGEVIQTLSISDLLDCANKSSSTLGGDKCKGVPDRIQIPNFVNFISLDVEGQGTAVLSTFPFDRVKVGAWVIERDFTNEGNNKKNHDLLAKWGYKLVQVENPGVDEYFVRPEFWDESLGKKDWRVHPEGSDGC